MVDDADDGGPAVINNEQAMVDILFYDELAAVAPIEVPPPRRPDPVQPTDPAQPPSTPGPVSEGDADVKRKRPENNPSSAGALKKQENTPDDSTSSNKPQTALASKDAVESTVGFDKLCSTVLKRHTDFYNQTVADMTSLEAELSEAMAKLASENKDLRTRLTRREAEISAELEAAKDEITRLKADKFRMGMGMRGRLRKLSRHNAGLAKALAEKEDQNTTLAAENILLKPLLDAKDEKISKLTTGLGGLRELLDIMLKDQNQSRDIYAQQFGDLLASISGSHATNGNPSADAYAGQAYGQAVQQQRTESPGQLWAFQSGPQLQSSGSVKKEDSEEKDDKE
ncbi:hypothetical protein MAPG_05810 [Magnaporthiopsis poae ATCC 64411]|uniref:Uncharacterized protein n=1 Tax=Magnaporthiopsis poae (strain ATCC 64411 / 73-15) TaxID=644358 RepID=A0A0C4E0D7_MAGP6|nr:hypothetical protein MAPG_05810 [Magnaporthiopsis poae ATCC 64411]